MTVQKAQFYKDISKDVSVRTHDISEEIYIKGYLETMKRKFIFYPIICTIMSSFQFISIVVWLFHTSQHHHYYTSSTFK